MDFIDLIGQKFGRWTVIRRGENTKAGQAQWLCRCQCGNEKQLKSIVIRRGLSKSCGCLKREMTNPNFRHGHAAKGITPTYHTWAGMKARCSNPKNSHFMRYGGRGITVCERWESFANFLADMGEKPEGLSLDRVNNDGNYEKSNCRWATWAEQAHNKSKTTAKHH